MNLSKGLISLKFSATWCGPCKLMAPKMEQIEKEFPQVKFISADVDEETDLVKQFSVQSVPTVILLRDGEEVARLVGAQLISPLRTEFRKLIEG